MKNKTDNSDSYSFSESYEPNKDKRVYVDIYSSERKKAKRKKLLPIGRILSLIFFLIVGTIGVGMIHGYNTLHSVHYDDTYYENGCTTAEEVAEKDGLLNDNMVLNVLLIGSDSMSTGDHGRSDSLLILSLNIRSKKIKITSLMRDTWVNIPGFGKDRLNASYAFGGPKLTIETIHKNFGVLIDRYACVDFEGFSKIIDSLGGIDIELTSKESAYINKYSGDKNILKGSGVKHLTGLQALHHSRNRNSKGSDYDRTSRQREVIKAVLETLKKSNVAKITEMVTTLAPFITTNFKTSEISRLVANCMVYLSYPLEEFRIPTDNNVRDATYDQKMVLVINDIAKAKSDIKTFIYEDSELKDNNK